MDYTQFMQETLEGLGFQLNAVWNAYDPPYDSIEGWPLKLPDIEFKSNTLLLLHFQDFVTPDSTGIKEITKIEQHYKDRSHQVLITHWPHKLSRYYNGPINLIEFNSHDYNIVRNLKAIQDQWIDRVGYVNQRWQCLNGRRCNHRQRAVSLLKNYANGIVSYSDLIPLDQWAYSSYFGTENEDNFLRLINVYGHHAINIITETQYDHAPGIITEKTYMALLAKQIPIVIGYPGIVADCESMGMDMFTDLVDVSYDYLPNELRVEEAILRNQDLLMGQRDLTPYRARLQKQQQWLLDKWPEKLRSDFVQCAKDLANTR